MRKEKQRGASQPLGVAHRSVQYSAIQPLIIAQVRHRARQPFGRSPQYDVNQQIGSSAKQPLESSPQYGSVQYSTTQCRLAIKHAHPQYNTTRYSAHRCGSAQYKTVQNSHEKGAHSSTVRGHTPTPVHKTVQIIHTPIWSQCTVQYKAICPPIYRYEAVY